MRSVSLACMLSSFAPTNRKRSLQCLRYFVQTCAPGDCHSQDVISSHSLMRCPPYTMNPEFFGAGGGIDHIPENGAAAAC